MFIIQSNVLIKIIGFSDRNSHRIDKAIGYEILFRTCCLLYKQTFSIDEIILRDKSSTSAVTGLISCH